MRYLVFAAPKDHVLEEGGQSVHGGEEFQVSEARADELLADPHVGVFPAPDDSLHHLTREKLNELASQAGLDPEQYQNKQALIEALTIPPAATGEGQDDDSSDQEA